MFGCVFGIVLHTQVVHLLRDEILNHVDHCPPRVLSSAIELLNRGSILSQTSPLDSENPLIICALPFCVCCRFFSPLFCVVWLLLVLCWHFTWSFEIHVAVYVSWWYLPSCPISIRDVPDCISVSHVRWICFLEMKWLGVLLQGFWLSFTADSVIEDVVSSWVGDCKPQPIILLLVSCYSGCSWRLQSTRTRAGGSCMFWDAAQLLGVGARQRKIW